MRLSSRYSILVASACVAAFTVVLAACGTGGYTSGGNESTGKQLFVQRCGGCHTLADAGTAGTIGPNLDDAFSQARADGMKESTFVNVVAQQIRFPIENPSTSAPGMPAASSTLPSCDDVEGDEFCVEDQDQAIDDVAAYVGSVSGTGAPAERPTDGKTIFTTTCGSCHRLADAGTTGTVGPDLDQSRPSKELAVDRVTNGRGAMPSFRGTLDPAQIEAVAEYVSSASGR